MRSYMFSFQMPVYRHNEHNNIIRRNKSEKNVRIFMIVIVPLFPP